MLSFISQSFSLINLTFLFSSCLVPFPLALLFVFPAVLRLTAFFAWFVLDLDSMYLYVQYLPSSYYRDSAVVLYCHTCRPLMPVSATAYAHRFITWGPHFSDVTFYGHVEAYRCPVSPTRLRPQSHHLGIRYHVLWTCQRCRRHLVSSPLFRVRRMMRLRPVPIPFMFLMSNDVCQSHDGDRP